MSEIRNRTVAESDSAELEREFCMFTWQTFACESNDAKTWKEEIRQETKRKEGKNGSINMPKYNNTLSRGWLMLKWSEVQTHSLLISALDVGRWTVSRPGHFTPEKQPRYPLNRRMGGPQSWSGRFGGPSSNKS
jgi:hypothetical protein